MTERSSTRLGPGPANHILDVGGLTVGHANDPLARTGTSVILFERPTIVAGDVRGGGPGARETDLLDPSTLVERADAIVLSGGSSYGLGAADGATAWLGAQGRGYQLIGKEGVPPSPIVPAAILYDLANGGDKNWTLRGNKRPPYFDLGEQACRNAGLDAKESTPNPFALGRIGAGYGAISGSSPGGIGSASYQTADGLSVGAILAVNSFGSTKMPNQNVFWAWPYELNDEFGGKKPNASATPIADFPNDTKLGVINSQDGRGNGGAINTTIGLIAVSAPTTLGSISQAHLKRIAVMAQDGIARAIRPIHGPTDGDILFAASIEKEAPSSAQPPTQPIHPIALTRLGTIAADVTARACARAVFEAERQTSPATTDAVDT